jgi:hypothetical protein
MRLRASIQAGAMYDDEDEEASDKDNANEEIWNEGMETQDGEGM